MKLSDQAEMGSICRHFHYTNGVGGGGGYGPWAMEAKWKTVNDGTFFSSYYYIDYGGWKLTHSQEKLITDKKKIHQGEFNQPICNIVKSWYFVRRNSFDMVFVVFFFASL